MSYKPFRPEDSALLLIDHQIGTMQLIKNIDESLAKKMVIALAKAAKILEMPVILTSSQEERIQGPLLPELQEIHQAHRSSCLKISRSVACRMQESF